MIKHGHTAGGKFTSEYASWSNMIARCTNASNDAYPRYGGRGILVCEKWLKFEGFLEDMGVKAIPGLSIEREDVNGNYEKSNCYWATDKQQARNKRSNRVIEFNGKKMPVSQWAEELGISAYTIRTRLALGWSAEKSLTAPVRKMRAHTRVFSSGATFVGGEK